ncbi:MAG: right-handed parallel beta-helix repeat-containing protein, partial [Sphingosinicella sp.]
AACLLILSTPVPAQQSVAPFALQETGEGFATLAGALEAAGDGDGTILIAPGRYRQCAVQQAGRIAFVARRAGTAIFDGVACEGKAALVLRGTAARVEGLVFQNIRVPDLNGAGIRREAGDLLVRGTVFRDGENGILVANDHRGTIRVEHSTFAGLGLCPEDQGCSHSIYNSGGGALSVSHSRFERGTGGHYVKSRSPWIEVSDSSFDDSQGHGTNYMIDLSDGASGLIARNVFVQGADKDNYSAFIMVAPESETHRSAGLTVTANQATLVPGLRRRTAFVASAARDPVTVAGNRLDPAIAPLELR